MTQNLKGKDVKNIKKVTGGHGFPEEKCEVYQWKVESRLHVYAVNGEPLFVDTTGKLSQTPLPTIFTLWRSPELLPAFTVIPDVSRFVLNGADLMWPGVYSVPLPLEKGQLVQIVVKGNPKAIAIGEVCENSDIPRAKGKAVKVMHYYGDHLCQEYAALVAPPGFAKDVVRAIAATHVDVAEDEGEEEEEADDIAEGAEPAEEEVLEEEFQGTTLEELMEDGDISDEEPKEGSEEEDDEEEKKGKRHARVEALKAKKEEKKGKKGKKGGTAPTETVAMSPEEMDDLVLHCFVFGITNLTKAELPMLVSTFYSQHMLPGRPEGSEVNLKTSTFKKIGVFMKTMEAEGCLKIKQKSAGVDQITEIDKRCKYIHETTQRIGKPDKKVQDTTTSSGDADPTILPLGRVSNVSVRYRPKVDAAVFKPVFLQSKEPLSEKEVKTVLQTYITTTPLHTRVGLKGNKGQQPDLLVQTNDVLSTLWCAKVLIKKTVEVRRLSEKASLGLKTDPTLRVTHVDADSPTKGMNVGDVITHVNDMAVKTTPEMAAAMKGIARNFEFTVKAKDVCPKEVLFSVVLQRLLKATLPAYSITFNKNGEKEEVVGKGGRPQVLVEVKNRASKKVTYVNNLDKFGFDIAATAKDLQLSLAGSVTVITPPVAPASSTILLQGRQLKQLSRFFERYNIPKDCVLVWFCCFERQ